MHYATIGAGPGGFIPNLVGSLNREADLEPHVEGINIADNNKCSDEGDANEDKFINMLLQLNANYRDDIDYNLFPIESVYGWNSNSYTSGLLRSAGVDVPQLPVNAPGWQKPVHQSAFLPRSGL